MTKQELMEQVLGAIANNEKVEGASKILHEAWEKASDEAGVPAATAAFVMACAAAISGAPVPVQPVFLEMFANTFNALSEESRLVTGHVREAKAPKGGKEPMGFRPTQAAAKC